MQNAECILHLYLIHISSPFYCEKDGLVDKVVDMTMLRSYMTVSYTHL